MRKTSTNDMTPNLGRVTSTTEQSDTLTNFNTNKTTADFNRGSSNSIPVKP